MNKSTLTTMTPINRRGLLKLAACAITVIAGCTNARQTSELDTAMSELDRVIQEMDDSKQQLVSSIVKRIRVRAQEMRDEHRRFTDSFDRLLKSYSVSEAEIEREVKAYNINRVQKRNDLLHLQDELHAAMPPEVWSQAVRLLNRAGKSLAGYSMSGG